MKLHLGTAVLPQMPDYQRRKERVNWWLVAGLAFSGGMWAAGLAWVAL